MKVRFLVSIAVFLASLTLIALGPLLLGKKPKSDIILIVDLFELVGSPQEFHEREVRVRGFVKTGSILYHYKDQAEFIMEQKARELKVFYSGKTQLPDTFTDGAPVRVDGQLRADNTFLSTRIEAKCASKYETPHAYNPTR